MFHTMTLTVWYSYFMQCISEVMFYGFLQIKCYFMNLKWVISHFGLFLPKVKSWIELRKCFWYLIDIKVLIMSINFVEFFICTKYAHVIIYWEIKNIFEDYIIWIYNFDFYLFLQVEALTFKRKIIWIFI